MPFKDPEKRRQYQREYHRRYYQKHSTKYKEKAKKWNRSQRRWARDYVQRVKRLHKCIDCGESNPLVLEFDHVKDKSHNISDMTNGAYSIEAIKKEMRKCEIRCANCHRIKTIERRNEKLNEKAKRQGRKKEG
mgnify:CR=1 FL=1